MFCRDKFGPVPSMQQWRMIRKVSNNLDISIRLFDVVSHVPQKHVQYLALIGWDMLNFFQLSARPLQSFTIAGSPQTIHAWCCKYQCTLGTFKAQPVYLPNQSFQNEKSSRRHQECPIRNQAGSFPAPRHMLANYGSELHHEIKEYARQLMINRSVS